eukprot:538567_1
MKPDWDKLMEKFNNDPEFSKNAIIADVDCTKHEELCSSNGVQGYPTIKYGDVADLQDYEGGREYEDMEQHAKNNLGPSCGPDNLDLCEDEQKKTLEELAEKSDEWIDSEISK